MLHLANCACRHCKHASSSSGVFVYMCSYAVVAVVVTVAGRITNGQMLLCAVLRRYLEKSLKKNVTCYVSQFFSCA